MRSRTTIVLLIVAIVLVVALCLFMGLSNPQPSRYEEGLAAMDKIEIPEDVLVAEPVTASVQVGGPSAEEGEGQSGTSVRKGGTKADDEAATEEDSKWKEDDSRPVITRVKRDGTTERVEVLTPEEATRRIRRIRRAISPNADTGAQ